MDAYRKTASVQSQDQAKAVLDAPADCFGAPPTPVLNLLAVPRSRTAMGITELCLQGDPHVIRPAAGVAADAAQSKAAEARLSRR